MKKSRIIALVLLLSVVVGVSAFNYVMHGGGRNLLKEETNFSVSSNDLAKEFSTNTNLANAKYLEKAVAVKGIVADVNNNVITLDNGIVCTLQTANNAIKKNQVVTIKGRVVGYDDLMEEIKLDQCFSM
jgi:hypothetical protein